MFPARFAPVIFGLCTSGMMSLVVSGIATYRAIGWAPGEWLVTWVFAWMVAFPTILVVAPVARRIAARATSGGS